MRTQIKGVRVKINEDILRRLDVATIFILEQIGLPEQIAPLGGTKYTILSNPYIDGYDNLILGKTVNTDSIHYLIMNINSKKIYHQWNYSNVPNNVFINSNLQSMLLSEYSHVFLYVV